MLRRKGRMTQRPSFESRIRKLEHSQEDLYMQATPYRFTSRRALDLCETNRTCTAPKRAGPND
ncbi:hypothetical protein DD563_05140 [Pelagicola sp. LXJ1103]|nr:hypothetical protein DD563_05140 [Pelagicola sp. LXJ1103]